MRKVAIWIALMLPMPMLGQVSIGSGVLVGSDPSITPASSDPNGTACAGGLPNTQYQGTMYTCKGNVWTASGSGGTNAPWHHIGPVINPLYGSIYSDTSPQAQESTTLISTSPEILKYLTKVRVFNWDTGWWPNQKICFGEAPDDFSQPTRFPSCIAGEARANLVWDPVHSTYALLAQNESTGLLDVFENATISGLSQMVTPTYSSVLACGGNGSEAPNSFGGADAIWDAAHSLWRVFYGCQNSVPASGNGWQSWLATGPDLGHLTKYQAAPVCGYGTTSNPKIIECGFAPIAYINGALYGYASTGPTGVMPTPYFFRMWDTSGVGNALSADPDPALSWQSWMEGLNSTPGQIAGMYLSPSLSGTGTMIYYGVLNGQGPGTMGCIAGAENPQPLTTVLTSVVTDAPEPIAACTVYGLYDAFTGTTSTALEFHSSDSQHSWHQGWTGTWPSSATLSGSGTVAPAAGQTTSYFSTFKAQTPNYTVKLICNVGTSGSAVCGALGRGSAGQTFTGYAAMFTEGTGLSLYKYASGTPTQLGATYTAVLTGTHTITLFMIGDNIQAYMDGTLAVNQTDSTYTNIGVAGFVLFNPGSESIGTFQAF